MLQVVVTADQAKPLNESNGSVEIVDANGTRLGTLLRPPNEGDVQIAKERIDGDGKRHNPEEVIEHLRSLASE